MLLWSIIPKMNTEIPGDALVQACLEALDGADAPGRVARVAADRGAALLGTFGVASLLVGRVALKSEPHRDTRLAPLEVLIEQARMDAGGRGRLGERFLSEARDAIEVLIEGDTLDVPAAHELTLAYSRADVEAPEALVSFLMERLEFTAEADSAAGELEAEIDLLRRQADGDDHPLHRSLDDRLRIHLVDDRAALAHDITGGDEAYCGRLALYWLLDASADARLAAAGALYRRAQRRRRRWVEAGRS